MKKYSLALLMTLSSLATSYVSAAERCGILAGASASGSSQNKLIPKRSSKKSSVKANRGGAKSSSEIIYQYGQVSLNSLPNKNGAFKKVAVKNGDFIQTGPQSFAVIRTANGSQITLSSDSAVRLKSVNRFPIEVDLKQGRIDNSVVPASMDAAKHAKPDAYRFLLTTPSLNLGVRGTQFKVEAQPDHSLVSVEKGLVDIEPNAECGQTAHVAANEGVSVSPVGGIKKAQLLMPPTFLNLPPVFKGGPVQVQLSAVEGAESYRIQAAHDPNFNYLIEEHSDTKPEFMLTSLDNGYYYIKVTAIDHNGIESAPVKDRILFQYN